MLCEGGCCQCARARVACRWHHGQGPAMVGARTDEQLRLRVGRNERRRGRLVLGVEQALTLQLAKEACERVGAAVLVARDCSQKVPLAARARSRVATLAVLFLVLLLLLAVAEHER